MTQQNPVPSPPNPDHDRSKLGVILDPTLQVKCTKKIRDYLKSRKDGGIPSSSSSELLKINSTKSLSISQLKAVLEAINEDKKNGIQPGNFSLRSLLENSEVILPQLEVPERDPKLEERINRLKNDLAEKEYRKMTKNVNLTSRFNPEDSIGSELKKMNTGLIAVFQFVVTVGAAFAFGFMGIEVFIGVTFELAVKLLLGIVLALVVGAAELYFLVLNMDFGDKVEQNVQQHQRSKTTPVSSPSKKLN